MDLESDFDDDGMYSDDFGGDGVEDSYYNAKSIKTDDPERALREFQDVINSEPGSEWAVRSAKQSLKVKCAMGPKEDDIIAGFVLFLKELARANGVSESYKLQSFTKMSQLAERNGVPSHRLYETALEILSDSRLAQRAALNLARCHIDEKNIGSAHRVLETVRADGPLQLETLALKMQLALDRGDSELLKTLYDQASTVKTEIAAPQVLALIHEVGGVAKLRFKQLDAGCDLLLKSFKSYDEAGKQADRMRVLRLYVLAMLVSGRYPFDLQEIKAFESSLDVSPLVHAYQSHNVQQFRLKLAELPPIPQLPLLVDELQWSFNTQALLWIIRPYSHVTYKFLETELQLPFDQLKCLIVQLILDHRLVGMRLNDVEQVLEAPLELAVPPEIPEPHFALPSRFRSQHAAREQKEVERRILNNDDSQPNPTATGPAAHRGSIGTVDNSQASIFDPSPADAISRLLQAALEFHSSIVT